RKILYNKILRERFGYDSLKDQQFEIIDAIITDKRDVCAILTTSFGKSMCYQLPFLITNLTVIVVSPLLSLMKDQKSALENLNIPVSCLDSNCKNKNAIKKEILDGKNQIVFM